MYYNVIEGLSDKLLKETLSLHEKIDLIIKTLNNSCAPKKQSPEKPPPKRTSPENPPPKRTSPKRTSSEKTPPKRTSPKKQSPKRSSPKKEPTRPPVSLNYDVLMAKHLLKRFNINTKAEWKKWLLLNHPDKGGNLENAQFVIKAGKTAFT